jgi:hypothetical protein
MTTKTIQINKDLFSLSGRTRKSGSSKREKKQKPKTLVKPNKVRKEFIKKIQAFQDRKKNERKDESSKTDMDDAVRAFDDEFSRSLSFLQDLSVTNNKKQERRNKTRKKRRELKKDEVDIEIEMPPSLEKAQPSAQPPKQQVVADNGGVRVMVKPEPPYSSLKGGSRPTYREWMRTRKRSPIESTPSLKIDARPTGPPVISVREKKLADLKSVMKAGKKKKKKKGNPLMIRSKKTTRTIKRKLGKSDSDRKVGVLIKSRETRKRIQTEKAKLGGISIVDIKRDLRSKNLIKSGTRAPNDVLRKIYEQNVLSGGGVNNNGDTLVHNYINDL